MASFRDLLQQAKAAIREVDPAGAEALLDDGWEILDVREPDEFEQGTIEGSLHIPRGQLESTIEARVSDRATPIVVMCGSGVRSAFAWRRSSLPGRRPRRCLVEGSCGQRLFVPLG